MRDSFHVGTYTLVFPHYASSGPAMDSASIIGKTVNFKYYNHLIGIHNRASHLNISELDELSVNVEGGNQHAVMDDDGRLHCGTWYPCHHVQGQHTLYKKGLHSLLSYPASSLVSV